MSKAKKDTIKKLSMTDSGITLNLEFSKFLTAVDMSLENEDGEGHMIRLSAYDINRLIEFYTECKTAMRTEDK